MKRLLLILFVILSVNASCQIKDKEKIIQSDPFLAGKWSGEATFLDVKFNNEFGPVHIEIEIREDGSVSGQIGDASITKTSIKIVDYGFEIKGILDSKVKKDKNLNKNHLVFLFIVPKGSSNDLKNSESNFHLKSNYFFDFTMRIGKVNLTKTL